MQGKNFIQIMGRRVHLSVLASAGVLVLLSPLSVQSAHAQKKVSIAPPGNSLTTPGPLAQNLSAKFNKPDLAKAMRIVADWQLSRMPAEPQYDWTWAALYAGFMGVPDAVAGDEYRKAMQDVADKLEWQPGPRVEHADDQAVGQMYMEQYFIHKDAKMMGPMKARLDEEIATPDDPAKPLWWWCDALFMAPPVFADMAKAEVIPAGFEGLGHAGKHSGTRRGEPDATRSPGAFPLLHGHQRYRCRGAARRE